MTASSPDGTDPRILTPDADEDEVKIARGYSTGKSYHTTDCATVEWMNSPNTVPESTAKWKGYTKCARCEEREGGDGYPHGNGSRAAVEHATLLGMITPAVCVTMRALLVNGGSKREVADQIGVSHSTVRRHTNECGCDHDAASIEYSRVKGWHTLDDGVSPVGYADTPHASLSAGACTHLRRVLVESDVRTTTLSALYDIDDSTVQLHARGDCQHDAAAPPLSFDMTDREWTIEEGCE